MKPKPAWQVWLGDYMVSEHRTKHDAELQAFCCQRPGGYLPRVVEAPAPPRKKRKRK